MHLEGLGVVRAEEGVAGEHLEAVGEGEDFGLIGRVTALEVVAAEGE